MDRNKPPQVNLKDRIAALQQRNAAASTSTSNTNLPAVSHQKSLKEKISQFEQKGGVPIPRGSFGLGAPPVTDSQKSRELYGNRIPTPVRVTGNIGNGPNSARVGSPMSFAQPSPLTGRKLSLTAAEFDDFSDYGSPNADVGGSFANYRALSPQNTGGSALQQLTPQHTGSAFLESLPRGTAFAKALEKARRMESGTTDGQSERQLREGSASPKALSQSRYLFTQNTGESAGSNDNMSDTVLSNVQIAERRRSFMASDIKDTVPLSPDFTFEPSLSEPPVIQVTTELTPITSEPDEETPPPSPFLSQPCYKDHVEMLPTVICSDCNAAVPLTELGDHHCAPPMSPLPDPEPIRHEEVVEVPSGAVEEDATVDDTLTLAPADVPVLTVTEEDVPSSPQELDEEDPVVPPVKLELVEPPQPIIDSSPQAQPVMVVSIEPKPQMVDIPPQLVVEPPQPVPEPLQLEDTELLVIDSEVDSEPTTPTLGHQPVREPTPDLPQSPGFEPVDEVVADVPQTILSFESEPDIVEETDIEISPPATPRRSPSQKTLPPRPVSMIVESPTRPSDPARGPFLVPSSYAPEHPKLPITSPEETEFGTVTFHRTSYSMSHSNDFVSHFTEPVPSLVQTQSTKPASFSAIVHGKVTELPARVGTLAASPQVVKRHKAIRDSIPITPATGDLASLLANAALLEQRLLEGELPDEVSYQASHEPQSLLSPAEAVENAVLSERPQRWQPIEHIKPEESKSRRRPSFRNPLSRSKSAKDHAPQVDSFEGRTRKRSTTHGAAHARAVSSYHPPPPPPVETTHARAQSQSSQPKMSIDETPPTPPPKSPVKYLSGLRRFTGRHSGSTSSEVSSDDSMLIVTPPTRSPDFFANESSGQDPDTAGANYVGGMTSRTGITWPSLSTKKSIGSLSRATSFAEKIWPRKRTKSSISNTSEVGEQLDGSSVIPPLPRSFDVPRVPPLPDVIPPPTHRPNAPLRSKSLYEPRGSEAVANTGLIIDIPAQPTSLLAPPQQPSAVTTRPSSWVSISTTSSSITNPSPLLDMFDDFPAVPESPPMPSPPGFRRPMSSFHSLSEAAVPRSVGGNLSSTIVHPEIRYNATQVLGQ